VVPAAVVFAFDPLLHIGDAVSVRIETLAIAVVLFAALVVFVRIAQKTPAVGPYVPAPGLRPDDLMFIVVGAVPGALFGGRLGYVLAHLDYYGPNPSAAIDMAQGGLSLTLAVPFGVLTGAAIARLIGAPVARWLHASAFPLLFVLSLLFFRSLVAALLPLLVGGLAIVGTFLMLRVASELEPISVFALNLVTGLGLGLAIDYSLFMVSRRQAAHRGG